MEDYADVAVKCCGKWIAVYIDNKAFRGDDPIYEALNYLVEECYWTLYDAKELIDDLPVRNV